MTSWKPASAALRLLFLILSVVLLGTQPGCGGGGGPATFTLIYQTDWTQHLAAGGGLSQNVTLYDSNNLVLGNTVLNQDVAGKEQFVFNQVPKGSVRLVVELYAARDLLGGKTGIIEAVIDLRAATTFSSAVGVQASQLVVTPPSASLQVPQSQRFVATGFSAPGMAAFLTPGSVTWQALGGVATVDSASGLAISTSAGAGSIKALHSPDGINALAPITVLAAAGTTSKWTIMVYLNAANDLSPFALMNFNQMESVAQNPNVRIVVQWKQATGASPSLVFNSTRRYLVAPDSSSGIHSPIIQDLGTGVDMGRPQTLKAFIDWTKTYYRAQRYALVVWNHGNGWRRSLADLIASRAVSYDDDTGSTIQAWELQSALVGTHFEMIAWDASLMQMIEIAYEIRDSTTYVVGSEESPPGEGYPYDSIFKVFRDKPDADSATLAKAFVDGMLAVPAYQNRKITQSVLRSDRLPALASAMDQLATTMIPHLGDLQGIIPVVRSSTTEYSPRGNPPRYYLDLVGLAANLQSMVSLADVQAAAAAAQTAAASAVVDEGHTTASAGSHGISIDFTPGASFAGSYADYSQLRFGADTHWKDWLLISP